MSYEFKSTSYEFKSTSYEFKFTSYKFRSMSYEFKSTSLSSKAGVGRLKTRLLRLKARVRRLKVRMFLILRLHKYPHYVEINNLIHSSPSSLFESPGKQAFDFLKRNSHTNVSLKFLCDAKLITSFLIF